MLFCLFYLVKNNLWNSAILLFFFLYLVISTIKFYLFNPFWTFVIVEKKNEESIEKKFQFGRRHEEEEDDDDDDDDDEDREEKEEEEEERREEEEEEREEEEREEEKEEEEYKSSIQKLKKGEQVIDSKDISNLTLTIILEHDATGTLIFPKDFVPQPPPNSTVFTLVGMDAVKYIQKIQEDAVTASKQRS